MGPRFRTVGDEVMGMREAWRFEREARAHFGVIRLRRWPVALILVVAGLLAIVPWDRLVGVVPSLGNLNHRQVQSGVLFLGRDLSGRTAEELKPWLRQVAASLSQREQEVQIGQAQIVTETGMTEQVPTVIPGVNGYVLDVDVTLLRLLRARAGQRVLPALVPQKPAHVLSDFPRRAITRGSTAKPQVALMINVDWGEEQIPALLKALDHAQAKATFFVSGRWAQQFPNLLQQIVAAGHEVGSHGHNLTLDPIQLAAKGDLRADIQKSIDSIKTATGGKRVQFWAPHKGAVNQQVIDTAADLGYRTVLWSLDTVDWKSPGAAAVTSRVLDKVQAGDLILMHPVSNTVQALPAILNGLKSKGLMPVTLSEILSPDRPELPAGSSAIPTPPQPPTEVPTLAPTALTSDH